MHISHLSLIDVPESRYAVSGMSISKVRPDLTKEYWQVSFFFFLLFDENKQLIQQSVCIFMGLKQRVWVESKRGEKNKILEFIPIK